MKSKTTVCRRWLRGKSDQELRVHQPAAVRPGFLLERKKTPDAHAFRAHRRPDHRLPTVATGQLRRSGPASHQQPPEARQQARPEDADADDYRCQRQDQYTARCSVLGDLGQGMRLRLEPINDGFE
jgi:hypothetical protein